MRGLALEQQPLLRQPHLEQVSVTPEARPSQVHGRRSAPGARTRPQSPWGHVRTMSSEPLRTRANLSQKVLQPSPENARDRGAWKEGHLPQTPHLPLLTNGGFLQTPRPSRDFRGPFQRAGRGVHGPRSTTRCSPSDSDNHTCCLSSLPQNAIF